LDHLARAGVRYDQADGGRLTVTGTRGQVTDLAARPAAAPTASTSGPDP
jgi:hypothetical protein